MPDSELGVDQQLSLISRAWGKQRGYAFFPYIDGSAEDKSARRMSYHEGPAFSWPRERSKILDYLSNHQNDDVYWCPSLFEDKRRVMELAMDEHALWADLDGVDPRGIDEEYRPTIAWETSPGNYQALWIVTGGDIQGASWPGNENQRLTYYLGADASGWDTTQLLRIPGWRNHKPDYRSNEDEPVQGKLLWSNGRRYFVDEFNGLPEVQTFAEVQTVLEDEVERVDRHKVWGEVRLKLPHRARELFSARETVGDRSEQLWWMMRCLADVGCSATEIVALVRTTVWNKFEGRQDELKRLTLEASKAISQRTEETVEDLEAERQERPDPQNILKLVKEARAPEWIVKDLFAVGTCGFIAGQPKTYKSWFALDLAFSVSTGIPFLDHFSIRHKGPVLYIQEEDGLPMVKSRVDKVWPGKQADKMRIAGGHLVWDPPNPWDEPMVNAMIRAGVTITDPGWQSWLDEQLEKGYAGEPYRMLLIDPLMMVSGGIDDEYRSTEMTQKLFRPLKQLADKHNVAVIIVHHMKKGDPAKPQRGGQMLLGSVANHAWAEDSIYIKLVKDGVLVERESKNTMGGTFKVTKLRNKLWTPTVMDDKLEEDDLPDNWDTHPSTNGNHRRSGGNGRNGHGHRNKSRALTAMQELAHGVPHTTKVVAEAMGISVNGAKKQLIRLAETGAIARDGETWKL